MANNDKKESKPGESQSISETLKKIISSGSPTEISKEIINTVVGQALKAKDDVALKVTNEMISLVKKIDFVKEFSKFVENHKFKVTAEIEITKKETEPKE
ncbi:MAG: hypothetical protein H7328_01275 [Bdellovibrio sp.]|nr:hypothetical protein [Bdellovibrio sp.]